MTLSYLTHVLKNLDAQMLYAITVWASAALIAGVAFWKCLKEA